MTSPPSPAQQTTTTSIPEKEAQQSKASFVEPTPEKNTAAAAASSSSTQTPASAKPTPRPRSKLRTPRKAAMKLTPSAVEHLRDMLDQPEPKLIKVGVRNRGCSGLAYHLEWVDKPGAFDEAVEQDGVKVLIDSKALFSIIGSEMDWVEDKLSQRFVFRNPNISEFPTFGRFYYEFDQLLTSLSRGAMRLRRVFHGMMTGISNNTVCIIGPRFLVI